MKLQLFCFFALILFAGTNASAQWVDPYNSNGKVKSIGQYEYDSHKASEQRSNYQRNYDPPNPGSGTNKSSSHSYTKPPDGAVRPHADFYIYNKIAGTNLLLIKRFDNNRFGIADSAEKLIGLIGENHDFYADIKPVESNGKYGYINKAGKLVTALCYEYAAEVTGVNGMVQMNGKYGFVDRTGAQVIPCVYDVATPYPSDRTIVKKGTYWGVIDGLGKAVIPLNLDAVSTSDGYAYQAKKNGKWGLLNQDGGVIVPLKYDVITKLDNYEAAGKYYIVKANNVYGLLNSAGQVLVKPEYNRVEELYGPYLTLVKDGKKGLYIMNRDMVLPCRYEDLSPDYFNLIWVKSNNKWGLVKMPDFKEITPCQYDSGSSYARGAVPTFDGKNIAYLRKDGKAGAIDTLGNILIPFLGEQVSNVVNDAGQASIVYQDKGLFGVSDDKGNIRIAPTYNEMWPFKQQKTFRVRLNGKWGVIDLYNKPVVPIKYSKIEPVYTSSNLVYLVCAENKSGIMDEDAAFVVPCMYDSINLGSDYAIMGHYSNKAFVVSQNGKWGVSSSAGKQPACIYDSVRFVTSGFVVCRDGKCGVLSDAGNELIALKYDYIPDYNALYPFPVMYQHKWGYIDNTGHAITEFKFDETEGKMDYNSPGVAKRKGKKYFIDRFGGEYSSITAWYDSKYR